MKLVLISGDGTGAGKTTLARKMSTKIVSLADAIRMELTEEYPEVDFWDKSQAAKNKLVSEHLTVRDLLKARGQERRNDDPDYWIKALATYIKTHAKADDVYAIDDIRFINEVSYFKKTFEEVTHVHVCDSRAVYEPEFDNNLLWSIADYTILRKS